MTVAELIEKLREMPQELGVWAEMPTYHENAYGEVGTVEVVDKYENHPGEKEVRLGV
jgi:hypothetical protein